jgi:hypothetical protein
MSFNRGVERARERRLPARFSNQAYDGDLEVKITKSGMVTRAAPEGPMILAL